MKPCSIGGKGAERRAEPVGVLDVERFVFSEKLSDFAGVSGCCLADLNAEPFVDDQPLVGPLLVKGLKGILGMLGANKAAQCSELVRHVVGVGVLFCSLGTAIKTRDQPQDTTTKRAFA